MAWLKWFLTLASVIYMSSAYYQTGPKCLAQKGKCQSNKLCRTVIKHNLCPGPNSIKCCVPIQEARCSAHKGQCQWDTNTCDGNHRTGLCPTQPAGIRCCVPSTEDECGNKYKFALKEIFRFEGKCQNWPNDSGNKFHGRTGYTCMGITPGVGWINRGKFPQCSSYKGHPSMFVKYCYDKDASRFKRGAGKIYTQQYLMTCSALDNPAFFVCSDIAVNSGTSRVRQFMKSLGSQGNDAKSYARKLNEIHRKFYKKIGVGKNTRFLKGWLKRAAERDNYINRYNC